MDAPDENPGWGQLVKIKIAVRGDVYPDREYPPGTIGMLLETLVGDASRCLIELRLPDSRLVGGHAHDVVAMKWSDLEV